MRLLACTTLLFLVACQATDDKAPDWGRPLPYGASALIPLDPGEAPPSIAHAWLERTSIQDPLARSIQWTRRGHAPNHFPIAGVTHERALRSLERFEEVLTQATSANDFQQRIDAEFTWYKSAGWDGRGGGVLFTGYCTPILDGSMEQTAVYRHPLYALPADLVKATDGTILGRQTEGGLEPYPTRRTIEAGFLRGQGLELCYLRDPLDAFIAHVNGSAVVRLPNGGEARFGYAGKNGRPYTSLGGELVKDGEIDADALSLQEIRRWASRNPRLVSEYMERNASYVFFQPITGGPHGSLDFEVAGGRSLATDKSLFPRGAICFVDTTLPMGHRNVAFRQLMFDQDTGGAIRTAGRADIYLGIGPEAERRAGATRAQGQLYYLFLKE